MSTSDGTQDWYTGGQAVGIPNGGGTVAYSSSVQDDGTFDLGLVPNGVAFLLSAAVATPNPAYALSPVKLACAPTTAGTYTYQWFTDDGTGATPPNMISISGATATNLTVIPNDINPGGADYTTNYYFVATRTADSQSVTSTVATLTVHAASLPVLTDPTPTNLVTYVGNNVIYTAGEIGTQPMTNIWQFNNGGGFVSLTGNTNTTLTLNNVQTTASGSYQLVATNLVGTTNTDPVTLTVLSDPAAPNLTTQPYYSKAYYTNTPWAYWRLNETTDPSINDNPGAPIVKVYDYSGHGFLATYGNQMTVSNAGPSSLTPGFPGFDTNELAAGTLSGNSGGFMTVPSLNMAGNTNVTFIAWINPSGAQNASAALLFNRGGADGACGFGFGNTSDHLGYTWNNNSAATYNWDSGLTVADSQWNFVAYVITPTNATVYLGNLSGGTTNFSQAVNPIAHIAETFSGGTICLGADPQATLRNFNGLITEATLFTNALSTAQIQGYFLTAIGASALAPSLGTPTVTPAVATSSGVYSGQNVILSDGASGTAPLTNQWQASIDGGTTWTNIPGATGGTFVDNPLIVGAVSYQLVSANVTGSVTSAPVAVTYNALPTTPAGLWTINFEYTNNIAGPNQIPNGGLGSYVGRGILGNGMFWNMNPAILTGTAANYNSGNYTNTSSLADNGATQLGVNCLFNNGGNYNGIGTLASSYNPMNLTEQWFRGYGEGLFDQYGYTVQLSQVPDGTYNVACYGGAGITSQGSQSLGSTFVVVDPVNGNQTNVTACPSPVSSLQQGVNFVVFTNVHAKGGTLNVSVTTNNAVDTGDTWGTVSAVQLQAVSFDPPVAAFTGTPTIGLAPLAVTFANTSTGGTNYVWNFGDGSSFTNSTLVNVPHTYAAGTYTVILTANGQSANGSSFLSNSLTNTLYITATNALPPAPVAGFSGTPTNGFAPLSVTFTDASTGSITNWVWSFGDGTSVTNTSNATQGHTYATAGTNTVTLIVNGAGGSSTNTQTAYITAISAQVVFGGGSKPSSFGSGKLGFSGTGGPAGVQYRILTQTNVAQPLANWTPIYTNTFNPDGSYGYTNSTLTGNQGYLILVSP